jgi:thiol-disulfide isomerase/thioredoxin
LTIFFHLFYAEVHDSTIILQKGVVIMISKFGRIAALICILSISFQIDAINVRGATQIKTRKQYEELTKGKPHVIIFSAEWCGACKAEKNVKNVQALIDEYPDVVFVIIDSDNPETAYLKKQHGVQALPSYVFVDANGKTVHPLHRGMLMKKEDLDPALRKLSTKKAVSQPKPQAEKAVTKKEPVMIPTAAIEKRAEKKVKMIKNGKKVTTKVTAKRTIICPADTK